MADPTLPPNGAAAPALAPPGLPAPLADAPGAVSEQTAGAAPPQPPPPQPNWAVRSGILSAEYVAGGGYPFLSQYIRSLPHYVDDLSRDYGGDIYDRMLLDPQCSSAVRLLKEEALSAGVRLEPAVMRDQQEWQMDEPGLTQNLPARDLGGRFVPGSRDGKNDEEEAKKLAEEAELAEEITDFCEQNLLHLDRPFVEVLFEMLDAVAVGNKVAEQVYEMRHDDGEPPRLWLKALKVKPRTATAFVMDPYMNLVGLLGMIPGQAYPVLTGSVVADPRQIPNLLARDKFAIFTWGSQHNDPRGTSLLRQVYNPWYLKMQTWGEYARYLVKFAGPSLVGYTAPNAQPVPPTDALGNPIPGQPLVYPETAMLNALLNFVNGCAVVFPSGAKVDPMTMSGDGGAYRNAIELFDKQITKGILCQTLATDVGNNMARAASQTHQDVLDIIVLHVKTLLAAMIYKDVLFNLVKYNWGEKVARRLTPVPHLAAIQQHNWAKDASAVAALVTSQYLDHSQFAEMDARLGLPKRSAQAAAQTGPVTPTGMGGPKGLSVPGVGGGLAAPAAGGNGKPVVRPGVGQAMMSGDAPASLLRLINAQMPGPRHGKRRLVFGMGAHGATVKQVVYAA